MADLAQADLAEAMPALEEAMRVRQFCSFIYIYVLMKIAYNSLGFVIDVAYDTSAVVCSFLTFDAPNLFLWLIVSVFAVTNFQ